MTSKQESSGEREPEQECTVVKFVEFLDKYACGGKEVEIRMRTKVWVEGEGEKILREETEPVEEWQGDVMQ